MELWELSARESVRDLIARYNANGDSGRWAEVEQLFAPDAVMDVDGTMLDGREAIMDMFRATKEHVVNAPSATPSVTSTHTTMQEWTGRGRKPFIRHFTATTQIDVVSEELVRARSYYVLLTVHGVDHWGRYVDEFGIRDGRWVFTRRQEILEAALEGGWAAPTHEANAVRGLGWPGA